MKDVRPQLQELLAERILVLDGAWGVLIHRRGFSEEEYRGERFAAHTHDVKGDPTFSTSLRRRSCRRSTTRTSRRARTSRRRTPSRRRRSGRPTMRSEHVAAEMSLEGARLARAAPMRGPHAPDKPRFVAGSVGPLNVTLSLSPKVEDAAYRAVTFDQVQAAYEEQIRALRDGGVDLLLVETIFDTLNAKAAIVAASVVAPSFRLAFVHRHGQERTQPVRQTSDAFSISVEHAEPFIVGVNCSLGATRCGRSRGPRERGDDLRLVSSQRRATERPRPPRRAGGGHEPLSARVRRGRPRQPRRRLLRHDPEHTDAIVRAVEGLPPRRRPEGSSRPRSRPRAVRDRSGHGLRIVGERTTSPGRRGSGA